MSKAAGTRKTCAQGHQFYKSSDCPACPICESMKKPTDGFMAKLSAPARRALQNAGLIEPGLVAAKTEKEILSLHGIGPSAIPVLKKELAERGLKFS